MNPLLAEREPALLAFLRRAMGEAPLAMAMQQPREEVPMDYVPQRLPAILDGIVVPPEIERKPAKPKDKKKSDPHPLQKLVQDNLITDTDRARAQAMPPREFYPTIGIRG
jgi:hypothetical protein